MSELTKEKYLELKINEIIKNTEKKDYQTYSELFLSMFEKESFDKSEIYNVLYQICSTHMSLYPNDITVCYTNYLIDINNIDENILLFLDNILDVIEDDLLKGRVADFLYLNRKNNIYAKKAIDSYLKINLEANTVIILHRVVDILKYNKESKEILENIYNNIIDKIKNTHFNIDNEKYFYNLSNLICKVGLNEKDLSTIISKLDDIMNNFIDNKNYEYSYIIEKYINLVDEIFCKTINEKYRYYDIIAKYFINIEANSINKYVYINKAIEFYYKMPIEIRNKFISNNELEELRQQQKYANIEQIANFNIYEHNFNINTNDIINQFQKIIDSFNNDIIKILHYTFNEFTFDKKNISKNYFKPSIVDLVADRTIFDKDRLKSVDIPNHNTNPEEFKIYKTTEYYRNYINIYILLYILKKKILYPYLKIDYSLIYEICLKSNIIRYDRIELFAYAFHFCFKEDYIAGISILLPQIEDFIRYLLNSIGVNTRNKDRNNKFDKELSLDELLTNKKDDLIKIFGENIFFEFKTLLSNDNLCFNMRNNFCHGLVNTNDIFSYNYQYLWIFIFRIILISFINNTNYYNK